MNPVQALADWAKRPELDQPLPTGPMGAVDAWSRATRIILDREKTVVALGVRDLLSATFSCVQERNQELWLPEDVYPVYWELAKHTDVRARAFTTLPRPDWTFLAQTGECAAVLVPAPLSPVGRLPTDAEIDALFRWLRGSRRRLLIIDAVYTFDFSVGRALSDSLLADNQCLVLWSCSKSWLYPGVLGLAKVPASLAPGLRSRVSLPLISRLAGSLPFWKAALTFPECNRKPLTVNGAGWPHASAPQAPIGSRRPLAIFRWYQLRSCGYSKSTVFSPSPLLSSDHAAMTFRS